MSKTEKVSFQGKAKWNDLFIPNKFDKWEIVLYPDAPSLEKFKSLGTKNKVHEDEDGTWVRFSRPISKKIRGREVAFAPPIVTDKDNVIQPNVGIGHGSDVTVTCEKYQYNKPFAPPGTPQETAIRLEGVRIDVLVPYTKDDLDDPKLYKTAMEMEKQPAPTQGWR